ncbi:hypothetical protein Tco_0340217 [Tanacetum coccineum]
MWLEEEFKCRTPDQINDIISAELPCPTHDPDAYKVISEFMFHGPCGAEAKHAPCTNKGKCSKHFPKKFLAETIINEDGYPVYRHMDNKITAIKGKLTYNNKHVVPHNRYLLLKYHAHINVEWCNRSKAIKYLFKYLKKGPDRETIAIPKNVKAGDNGASDQIMVVDEIKNYLNCRFLSPCEAVWRLFSFDLNYAYTTVMLLNYHLPDQKAITLHGFKDLPALLEREGISITIGARSFTELKMVSKINYATFKVACFAYGLLNDDNEWTHAIAEAMRSMSSAHWVVREERKSSVIIQTQWSSSDREAKKDRKKLDPWLSYWTFHLDRVHVEELEMCRIGMVRGMTREGEAKDFITAIEKKTTEIRGIYSKSKKALLDYLKKMEMEMEIRRDLTISM